MDPKDPNMDSVKKALNEIEAKKKDVKKQAEQVEKEEKVEIYKWR